MAKSEVWDQATRAYNRLLFDSIPSFSYYKGNLDSASFLPIARRYLTTFSFLQSIQLFNLSIGHETHQGGISFRNLNFKNRAFVEFSNQNSSKPIFSTKNSSLTKSKESEFLTEGFGPLLKFSELINEYDSTRNLNSTDLFHVFYQISDLKISYLSIPGVQEMSLFRKIMMGSSSSPYSKSNQNLIVFKLNPFKLSIINNRQDLYQKILIKPLSFDSLSNNNEYFTTSIALPRAFSEYQLYFISSKSFLYTQAINRFLPQLYVFLGIYILLAVIGFLIFRNLSINNQLFKLQYDFINNFTHEFKTPVSVIKIAGESLKNDGGISLRELQVYGKILEEEADKLNRLMNRLLSFTQLENKVVRVYYEDLNLVDFFNEIIEEYHLKFPDFKIEYCLDNVSLVKTDKVLLNSIFSNLMDNAYKYSYPENKILKITVIRIRKWIVYRFIDEGIGIKNSEIEHIFNKFYKIENEFNVQGSIGIGLAFCKQVIGLMNGSISVSSEEGKGTEFRVKIPDMR